MISRNPRSLTIEEVEEIAKKTLPLGHRLGLNALSYGEIRNGLGILIARIFIPSGFFQYTDPMLKGRLAEFEAAIKKARASDRTF